MRSLLIVVCLRGLREAVNLEQKLSDIGPARLHALAIANLLFGGIEEMFAGTHRKSRDPKPIMLPAGCPPVIPNLHPRAKAEWERLAPLCQKVGLLTVADWMAWELGFRAYSTFLEATE